MNIEFGPPWLGSGLLFGVVCALIAANRGRSGVVWFLLGLLFNCFALIILLVLPDLRVEELQRSEISTENRRLREQMRKIRRKHAATQKRLDAHDRELKVDTSHLIEEDAEPMVTSPQISSAAARSFAEAVWFYLVDREQMGPVAFDELKSVWQAGTVGSATYVWCDGMADWQRLRELPELQAAIRA